MTAGAHITDTDARLTVDAALFAAHAQSGQIRDDNGDPSINHLAEVAAGEPVHTTTQVLHAAGKTLRLFHRLFHDDGTLLATGEHMLIHVDLQARRSGAPAAAIGERAAKLAAAHADLPFPDGAGRAIGMHA